MTVRDQILNNATTGLFLYSCTYSAIINNTCENNNKHGISLESSSSSTVANNTCNNNYRGISLSLSNSSTVANNTCSNNNWEGILLFYSDFCVITYNLLQENIKYGVYLFLSSDNNLIHHNTFVDNNLKGNSQALDDSTNNYWYDTLTLEGNYWSDWSGTGSYAIDGSTGTEDLYPLDEPC